MALQMPADMLKEESERLGRFLIAHFFILLKTAQSYGERHAAINAPVANLSKVLGQIRERNLEATLGLRDGDLYLGAVRLRQESAAFEAYRFVAGKMKEHQVGGISFGFPLSPQELAGFAYAFMEREGDAGGFAELLERMQHRCIRGIDVQVLSGSDVIATDRDASDDDAAKAGLFYRRALRIVVEATVAAGAGQPLQLREARWVVQSMIDLTLRGCSRLVALTVGRGNKAGDDSHAVNVCILSLALGTRAGISKLHLCELGMAALFHDIGKSGPGLDAAARPGACVHGRQRQEAQQIHAVKRLMALTPLNVMTSRIVSGIFEQYLLSDVSASPRFHYDRLGLHARILAIADDYELLTSSSETAGRALPPDKALRVMLSQTGKAYDPALLKLLLGCLGVHGIGSLLLLQSGELAVVVENNPDIENFDAPRVKLIADSGGSETDGEIIDLARADHSRAIAAVLDPRPYNLDVSSYL
jgi:hypothetical protein